MADLAVGDVLTTVEQLDALPNDATIRPTRRRGRATEKVGEKTWYIAGIDMPRGTHELLKLEPEWQVIWLPPPPPITEVTFETAVVWLDFDIPDDALPDSFEGRQVVVTVRVKEADDAE